MAGRARDLGVASEELACTFLIANGYRILDRNVRLGPGEIDVVTQLGSTFVFVEVKCRASGGDPLTAAAERVTARKQFLLRATALRYLASRGIPADVECRFDVVLVTGVGRPGRARLAQLKDAF